MASTQELSEVKVELLGQSRHEKGNIKAIRLKKVDPEHVGTKNITADRQSTMDRNNIGLALSGGGIRSAALSSGVLRRLLQKSVQIDYVSAISGGNITAASFVDWKYRHEKQNSHDWHHKYFENMRSRIGFVCDWTKPFKAVFELLVVVLLVFVNFAVPVLILGALSIPVAYVIDLIFGGILRVGFNCTDDVIGNGTLSSSSSTNRTIAKCGAKYDSQNHESYKATFCFVFFAIAFLACYLGKKLVSRLYNLMLSLQVATGVILGLTILPWLLQQYFSTAPLWLNILILTISVFFWMGFPPLRSISALAIIFYTFAFVIRWRVYRVSFPVPYLETRFYTSLLIAGTILWASPYLGASSRTSIYNYLKWRLQNAFYTRESAGRYGCGSINGADFFPVLSTLICCSHCDSKDNGNALNMASLEDMSPQYISNVVASYWRMNKEDRDKPPEAMISLSSKEIEIITEQPGAGTSDAITCNLHPKDIELADAMTTAALVNRPPQFEPFRELQIIVGLASLAISHTIQTDVHKDNRCACAFSKILSIILQSIAGAPIIFLAVLWLATNKLNYEPHEVEQIVMTVFIVYIVVFVAIAMLPTGSEKGWFGEDIVRWCHVHLYHVRFLREVFNINNVGPKPPALISLSDLGRVEKYGLLVLFKRRVKKIVSVDGSYIQGDENYVKQIIHSMELARQYLYCKFVGYDCRDVIGEIQKKYVGTPTEQHPRSYRFIVKYFDKTEDGFKEAGQGEVLLLSPRHPDKGIPFPAEDPRDMTWEEYTKDTNKDLDPNSWGTGPVLKDEEVDRLTFCCCECCHSSSTALQWVSKKLCNGFPHHSTHNQFFTPSMFSAYHREGYRACLEAGIEGFLSESTNKNV